MPYLETLHCAPAIATQQWRLFFETGLFNKYTPAAADLAAPALMGAKAILGAQRLQMLRFQVVCRLGSFMSNRANDFADRVLGSSRDETTRHQLLTINCVEAWFSREPVSMMSGPLQGQVIPEEIRKLARFIMRAVLARHRRPRFHRMNPNIDEAGERCAGPGDQPWRSVDQHCRAGAPRRQDRPLAYGAGRGPRHPPRAGGGGVPVGQPPDDPPAREEPRPFPEPQR
ncbi:hypothetical protein [Paracoccus endophyticus]|uniref:hypothetical protein n=1 Tax=Paracoccus endophyticus TaxID=2233774 RepID=UPI001F0C4924|nr:hypothetical protein [Paracoccus endophyticus]